MEKLIGFKVRNNPNYLYKDLGNDSDYVIEISRYGDNTKFIVTASHKSETHNTKNMEFYTPWNSDHTKRITNTIPGIVINKRYIRLVEGTLFDAKDVAEAVAKLESILRAI